MNSATLPLLRAPHRLAFLPGLLAGALLLLAWLGELVMRQAAVGHALAVPPTLAHGFLMLYGIFPFFMAGFVLTAGPRWLSVDGPRLAEAAPVPALMTLGLSLWLAGLWFGQPWLLTGTLLYMAGLGWLALLLIRLIRRSQVDDTLHARLVALAFLLGLVGLACAAYWLATGDARSWLWMRDLALWGCLLPVFVTVSHRMIPFFTASALPGRAAWRPRSWLFATLGGLWLHGLLSIVGWSTLLPDAVLTVLSACALWRWHLKASLTVPLLAMLHLAFAWLPVAFFLYVLHGLTGLSTLAPLHALTTGFCLTMLLGFASRVMLGHSGQPLTASPGLRRLYTLAQVLALVRVAADLVPAAFTPWLYLIAAAGWLVVFAGWARRFVPVLLRPRADGKPG